MVLYLEEHGDGVYSAGIWQQKKKAGGQHRRHKVPPFPVISRHKPFSPFCSARFALHAPQLLLLDRLLAPCLSHGLVLVLART